MLVIFFQLIEFYFIHITSKLLTFSSCYIIVSCSRVAIKNYVTLVANDGNFSDRFPPSSRTWSKNKNLNVSSSLCIEKSRIHIGNFQRRRRKKDSVTYRQHEARYYRWTRNKCNVKYNNDRFRVRFDGTWR